MQPYATPPSGLRRANNRARSQACPHPRVRARAILPGASYKVTKRCFERRVFLAPGHQPDILRNFIGYCLAYAANRYGIEVHAVVVMSNHYHIDLTDPLAELVPFKQLFNSLVARGINALRGRFDSFWSGDGACDTRRVEGDDSLGDLVYTLTNPVTAGLVKWGSQWPGFTTADWRFGEKYTFTRPDWFFDDNGHMPETVELILVRPDVLLGLDDDALHERLAAEVREAERQAQARLRAKGRRFVGVRKLAKQGWRQAPTSFEQRFRVAPRVAASSRWLRLAQLQRDRGWERAYAAARELWLAGELAEFPSGTYWLRRFAGVAVASGSP